MARARLGCGCRFFLLVVGLQSSECIAQIEVPQIVPGDPSGTFFAVGNWGWNTNPTDCPLRRMTGVTAFADPKSPSTPDDDSEYAVFCRSDGIFLVDVTPVLAGVGNAPKDLRPRGTVQYVQEPDWSYLGPAFTIDRSNNTVVALPPAPNTVNGGSHLDDNTWIALNGGMSPQNGTWSGASITPGVVAASYCRNLPVSAWAPYGWSTLDTTNREAAVYHDSHNDRFFIYSVSKLRDGIWIIPLVRNSAGALVPSTSYWDAVGGVLGNQHMIYIDGFRSQLWVTDDSNGHVRCIQIDTSNTASNGALLPTFIYDGVSGSTAHDAMPSGPSGGAPSEVWITYVSAFTPPTPPGSTPHGYGSYIGRLNLPVPPGSPPPQYLRSTRIAIPHSVCVDYSVAPANLWLLAEEFFYARFVANMSAWKLSNQVWSELQSHWPPASFDTYVTPLSASPGPVLGASIDQHAPAHHLRSVGRTGFVAQYHDGVGLVDLLDVPSVSSGVNREIATIAKFDTTTAVWSQWNYAHIRDSLDRFIGSWDVVPSLDSGTVLTNGAFEGGFALQVRKGQINRYALPTPLHDLSGVIVPLLCPRLEAPHGMPREGRTLTLKDSMAGRYPTYNGTLYYKWYFLCGSAAPFLTQPQSQVSFAAGGGAGVLQVAPSLANPQTGYLNLPQGQFQVFASQDGSLNVQSSLLALSSEWYCQVVVEQFDVQTNQSTGRWAASKGSWFGMAPLSPAYPQ